MSQERAQEAVQGAPLGGGERAEQALLVLDVGLDRPVDRRLEEALMRAIRLHSRGGPEQLVLDEVERPTLREGDALVRVQAAAITRDELDWPVDRLPAVPSYELSGTVAALAAGVEGVAVGDPVYALAPFDRDGAAADFAAVPASLLAPKPRTLDHVESAAVPLAALSAWQGLFDHGRLEPGERVLVVGASGGVGHFAAQLVRYRGAELVDPAVPAEGLEAVDLVFDTAGGEPLARSAALVREGGRVVSVAEEPAEGVYFVVEPNREQLAVLTRLVDEGELRPVIDSVFPLEDARAAFERSMARGKRGKVVLHVGDD